MDVPRPPRTGGESRLLVVSDTHGDVPALEDVLNWARDQSIDAAVFLGDGIQDLYRSSVVFSPEWKLVRGNNDYTSSVPEVGVFDFGGHRFFLCHGHRHNPYSGFNMLAAAARGMEADTVLFGHIHVPVLEKEDGILLVNPGSIGSPRGRVGATFAIIDCMPEKALEVKFWGIDPHGGIREVKANPIL